MITTQQYRAYFFTNMYLSSIQNGIQPLHATHTFFTKYKMASPRRDMLFGWAESKEPTVIVCNGGYSSTLREVFSVLDESKYPVVKFRESSDALDGALTCVGVILPSYMWETSPKDEDFVWAAIEAEMPMDEKLTEQDIWIVENLKNFPLAR